jgi:hypothetical protein
LTTYGGIKLNRGENAWPKLCEDGNRQVQIHEEMRSLKIPVYQKILNAYEVVAANQSI